MTMTMTQTDKSYAILVTRMVCEHPDGFAALCRDRIEGYGLSAPVAIDELLERLPFETSGDHFLAGMIVGFFAMRGKLT